MGRKDPRVDAYIASSAEFARPILKHIRRIVHAGCPKVEETLKWGFPHFVYQGILCSMASFKAHCAFGFWKRNLLARAGEAAMGQFGRLTSIADLPDEKTLLRLVKGATLLNDQGTKAPTRTRPKRRELEVADYFLSALRKNKKALTTFQGFSPGNRRDYVEWVTEAKGEGTRKRRLDTSVAWMAEGKVRNWKYIH